MILTAARPADDVNKTSLFAEDVYELLLKCCFRFTVCIAYANV